MSQYRFRFRERFNFFLERQFVKGAHVQLLFVIALIGLISIVGGLLVLPGGEPTESAGEAFWWAFLRLSDPGYLGDDEGLWRRSVSTLLTVAGYVVFMGSLVAIITSWLNQKIRTLEQGLTHVTAYKHVVILGWTNRTIHIAAELFQSSARVKKFLKRHGARSLKLIILSSEVTPARLQELRDHPVIGSRAKEIILRSGESIDREHLQRVDCMNASAIIIPTRSYANKELITPDVETIKTLLSLNAEAGLNGRTDLPYIVAELQDENKLKAAMRAWSGPLEVIASDTIISRLVAQNIRHYGLSAIYNELLAHSENNNLYAREFPQAAGKTMTALKKHFPKAIVLGVVRQDAGQYTPFLNPGADFTILENDKLVILARNLDESEWSAGPDTGGRASGRPATAGAGTATTGPADASAAGLGADAAVHSDRDDAESGTRSQKLQKFVNPVHTRLLILGWNHHIPSLIRELGTYPNEQFTVTATTLRPVADREKAIGILTTAGRVSVEHILADYIRESELRSLDPASFDKIVLVSSDKLADEEEADARTIVGYTLLEEILDEAGKRPHILMELADPNNEILIRQFRSEMIIGPLILSNLLATIAMRRELNSIYRELFTAGGAEIIFRDPGDYGLENSRLTFAELEERASAHHETALGITVPGDDANLPASLLMNPPRGRMLHIDGNTTLVVMSTV
ncbi:MAG: CASTOR/POLLUX-related putative ion channel [Cyclonatronaceae bacterium]